MKVRQRCAVAAVLTAWMTAQNPVQAGAWGAADEDREPAILRIKVLEGEGAAHPAGSRIPRAFTVQVTDETGKPVENVAVSFRLPEEGPGGLFETGLRSDLATTTPDGRVRARTIHWSRTPGPLHVRITAARGRARAGVLAAVYVTEEIPSGKRADARAATFRPRSRKLLGVLVLAGIAAGGVSLGLARRQPTVPAAAAASTAAAVQIGAPAISIGKP